MSDVESLSNELRELLISELNLKITAEELSLDEPLLSRGASSKQAAKPTTSAEIDSLDMLSLIMAIEDRYGVRLPQKTEELSGVFRSVRSIAENVERLRTEARA